MEIPPRPDVYVAPNYGVKLLLMYLEDHANGNVGADADTIDDVIRDITSLDDEGWCGL